MSKPSLDLRHEIAALRRAGKRIAFVPTMGNLHAGHLKLVQIARQRAGAVVASIYVNPLQFGPKEDLAAYPRTPGEDKRALEAVKTDLLFMPTDAEMYPRGGCHDPRLKCRYSAISSAASRVGGTSAVLPRSSTGCSIWCSRMWRYSARRTYQQPLAHPPDGRGPWPAD